MNHWNVLFRPYWVNLAIYDAPFAETGTKLCTQLCNLCQKINSSRKESSGELQWMAPSWDAAFPTTISKVYQISTLLQLPGSTVSDVIVKWKCLGVTTTGHTNPHRPQSAGKLRVQNSSGITSASGGAKQCGFSWPNSHRQAQDHMCSLKCWPLDDWAVEMCGTFSNTQIRTFQKFGSRPNSKTEILKFWLLSTYLV